VTDEVAVAVPVGCPAWTVQPAGTSAAPSRALFRASGDRVAVPSEEVEVGNVAGDEAAPPVDGAGVEHPAVTQTATAIATTPPDDLTRRRYPERQP